jgi:hydroxymethyl cephem carbamoyltransferase
VVISGYLNATDTDFLLNHTADSADLIEAGYWEEGPSGKSDREAMFAGHRVRQFSSSHVRSHIMCAYGLSPFPQGQPCYVLIWEGFIGAMYHIDEHVTIRKVGEILRYPGNRYSFIYALANQKPTRSDPAGKIMALAAYGRGGTPTPEQWRMIDAIMTSDLPDLLAPLFSAPSCFDSSPYYKVGVESQAFKDLAWQLSAALFARFFEFAKTHVTPGLPLLIAGGCGLNCEWNSQWRQCGLFSDVFIPPCANDSGVALGAAIDAQHHYTGNAKVQWSVYSGESFIEDVTSSPYFECSPLTLSDVCCRLARGDVIAWVQGRYEIGPRALGNRSLLAEPFHAKTRDKLNDIKQREPFRPIAPICLQEDFDLHFENHGPSPHMLYFQRVKSNHLAAITHVDGSARAQSVSDDDNPQICELLRAFRSHTGVGVLCNTSLNFNGRGFVNHLSQLFRLAGEQGIDGLVVGSRFWVPRETPSRR